MDRPKEYPYNARNEYDSHRRVQFLSDQWDKLGTRFFTIPINRGNSHWAGVIVERHAPSEGYATMHYYDLLNNSDLHEDYLHRRKIMEVIGESLNDIVKNRKKVQPRKDESFLPRFKWVYDDVVSASDFNDNGKIQKDGYSCGIIWMMIVWFVVTQERAPTSHDCRNLLWLSPEQLMNFRVWLAYSILWDRFWCPRMGTQLLLEYFDELIQPTTNTFRHGPHSIYSKLPPTPEIGTSMTLRPRRRQ